MTNDEMIAVITAHRDGAKIEFRSKGANDDDWFQRHKLGWDFASCDYRVAPTPNVRPFTDSEAVQLIGAVAVAPDDRRGLVGQSNYLSQIVIFGIGEMELSKLAELGWRWKWAPESDDQLKPFGVVEGEQ